jgi:membrane-associated phospholipid phosphatase
LEATVFDPYDVVAGAVLGVLIVSLLPNRFIMWTWKPKTKWGKRRVSRKADKWTANKEI